MNNLIPKVRDVFRPGQYRKVTLNGCIIARDGTAEETAISFRACFKQGSGNLDYLREVFAELYPNDIVIDQIPKGKRLTMIKCNETFNMSDGCNTAVKLRREVEATVKK